MTHLDRLDPSAMVKSALQTLVDPEGPRFSRTVETVAARSQTDHLSQFRQTSAAWSGDASSALASEHSSIAERRPTNRNGATRYGRTAVSDDSFVSAPWRRDDAGTVDGA